MNGHLAVQPLESPLTDGGEPANKDFVFRGPPSGAQGLVDAGIDVVTLGNNHVLDYGYAGLLETLDSLAKAGVRSAGAGRNLAEARAPAVIEIPSKGRVVVFSFGTESSGIPPSWAATNQRPGVNLLEDLSDQTVARIGDSLRMVKDARDVVVASIHWGANWGFSVPEEHVRFGHGLIEAGVDLIHGHSSHHVRPIEVFQGNLILHGCGDFLDDYEGITGREDFRDDLTLMYFPTVDALSGRLVDLSMTPMQIRRFRANRASFEGAGWLRDTLNHESRTFDVQVELRKDQRLEVRLT
jgi:poly-gamma-glutamate synthesis protein (capsule biosynthesis protein)